ERTQAVPGGDLPQSHRAIIAPGEGNCAVCTQAQCVYCSCMSLKGTETLLSSYLPHLDSSVPASEEGDLTVSAQGKRDRALLILHLCHSRCWSWRSGSPVRTGQQAVWIEQV